MRIKRVDTQPKTGFWAGSMAWLRSRYGLWQFTIAVLIGVLTAAIVWTEFGPAGQQLWRKIDRTLRPVTATPAVHNDLPTVHLDIGFAAFQFLSAKRQEALRRGILINSDSDWQQAAIRYGDQAIPVHIRLKGDWTDHLRDKKWSFRMKTRKGKKFMGMRVFSFQAPYTRNYLNQWLYFQDLRDAGLMTPRYSFINLVVNGESWGIYAVEENFSKELLESQGRREGVVIRFDENLSWLYRAGFGDSLQDLFRSSVDSIGSTMWSEKFAPVDDFNSSKVARDPLLREQSRTALGLLRGFEAGKLTVSQVFDPVQFGKYMAHNNLWSERHGLLWHNERYYFNAFTGKLEPIAYDSLPLAEFYGPFTDLARYDDPQVMEAYVQEVNRIASPNYLADFEAKYKPVYDHDRQILAQEFPIKDMQPPWNMLAERRRLLVQALHPPQTVQAYLAPNFTGETVDIRLANIIRYPVILKRLQVGQKVLPVQNDWVQGEDRNLLYGAMQPEAVLRSAPQDKPRYLTLHVPETTLQALLPPGHTVFSDTIQLITSLYAVGDPITVTVRPHYPPVVSRQVLPKRPSVAEALARYPFLARAEEPGFLELKSGRWHVPGDLILPDRVGLLATQPVTLTFDSGALLLANGPLRLTGPRPGSIYFGPAGDQWAGIAVLGAGDTVGSWLENVVISGTTGINRSGWLTTGGVTFYKSPVVLRNSRLIYSKADDDINIVHSRFLAYNSEFAHTTAAGGDGLDGDFVQGRIENCAFHDLRGDGVDLSGSQVTIDGAMFQHMGDKGISAGENSVITATRIVADDLSMAVASKDLSHVQVDDISIANAWVAGLAAYQKKVEYGPSRLIATNVHFMDSSPRTLAQKGSQVKVDNIDAPTVAFDVKTFYKWLADISTMRPLDYRFGSAITLQGMTLLTPKVKMQHNLLLSFYWRATARPDRDYTIFIHVLDSAGKMVAQQDVMPANNASRTSGWQPGQFVADLHTIPLPLEALPGEYHIVMGMYNWKTGVRLPALAPDGRAFKDDIVPLPVTFKVVP